MPTLAHAKNFGYTESNQAPAPESTRFTSPFNQSDAYHIGNDGAVAHDTFVWNAEEPSLLIIPATIATTSATAAIPAEFNNVLQTDNPSLLTQYFEGTLGATSDIVAPVSAISPEPQAVSQGDIDSLINGSSILPE